MPEAQAQIVRVSSSVSCWLHPPPPRRVNLEGWYDSYTRQYRAYIAYLPRVTPSRSACFLGKRRCRRDTCEGLRYKLGRAGYNIAEVQMTWPMRHRLRIPTDTPLRKGALSSQSLRKRTKPSKGSAVHTPHDPCRSSFASLFAAFCASAGGPCRHRRVRTHGALGWKKTKRCAKNKHNK